MKSTQRIMRYALVCTLFMACNKNSLELPPVTVPANVLSVPAKLEGLAVLDFVFHQVKSSTGDSVWLTVKNTTQQDFSQLSVLAELCQATEQNYDNCNLQFDGLLPALAGGKESPVLATWINRDIQLDAKRINVGIISLANVSVNPVSGIYNNVYASFENADTIARYYGNIRGYIFADGNATFRMKTSSNTSYNATGLFTKMLAFNGVLFAGATVVSPFSLDSTGAAGSRKLLDTANHQLNFRMRLNTPLNDTIATILSNTQKK
jgi:hypothetical protein